MINSQHDLPIELQILNLATNMGRVGNWISNLPNLSKEHGEEVYRSRIELIKKINIQTENYLSGLDSQVSDRFIPTLKKFKEDFRGFKDQKITKDNYLYLAEKALTWADILQIRAKLA